MAKEMGKGYTVSKEFPPDVRKELRQAVENEAREELGDDYKFIEAGKDAASVMDNFAVENRLDSMLDFCVKRLLHLRGLKSFSSSTLSTPLLPRPDGNKAA